MLYIRFGDFTADCITNINGYFNAMKQRDWFNNILVKDIIKEIDNSDAIKDEYIESPVLGAISPDRLSCGCKGVILLAVMDSPNIYATKCGDNCANKILEIAEMKDITITLHHCMKFPRDFSAVLVDIGKTIHNRKEYTEAFYDFRRKSWWNDMDHSIK